jgi:hypothetical protein
MPPLFGVSALIQVAPPTPGAKKNLAHPSCIQSGSTFAILFEKHMYPFFH